MFGPTPVHIVTISDSLKPVMTCAYEHVLHNDSEPTGVPPFTYTLPISVLLSIRGSGGYWRPGNTATPERCSSTELHGLTSVAGLEPATTCLIGEVTAIYATGQTS